ncbi:MAG: N-acetylmuramoyl-L-alanine amidase [Bacteroidota bacterium]
MREIKYLVVHCTATPVTATIESIRRYWKEVLKWKNPGYHYIIKRDGTIESINAEENISNGVAGYNKNAIHISYIGGISENGKPFDNRTDEQKQAMFDKLTEFAKKYPEAIILGHRDFSPDKNGNGIIEYFEWIKGCPAFDVKEWLEHYRPELANAA